MNERPTKKQRELLSFIDGFIKGNGYGPSYREVMRALDYKSVSTVATHIDGLIARGWLLKKDNSARSLIVVRPGTEESPSAMVAATPVVLSAEQEILNKIEALREAGGEANAVQIQTLLDALRILGYEEMRKTHVV